jgi:alkanesulfonate monooxygenase SsuD/methylene tetrahydromethanopterin reductase-like flavin-dependent oxidoreductase (luciferase family)
MFGTDPSNQASRATTATPWTRSDRAVDAAALAGAVGDFPDAARSAGRKGGRMTTRSFRFGVVVGSATSMQDWHATARRVESMGFTNLLLPDTLHTLPANVAAASAAAVTSDLRVGPYVLSAPNRTAGQVAVETAGLATLTGGRYELGIGAGRPDADRDAAFLGMPFGSPGERIRQVADTIAAVRERSPETRILVAGAGPRVLRTAGELADTVAVGLRPQADESALAAAVAKVLEGAGDRFDDVEISLNLFAVAGLVPSFALNRMGVDLDALRAGGSISMLDGTVEEMVAELERRRERYGLSYVATNLDAAVALAPVVERLTGR